jgi:two-component system response regulator NreC
MPIRCLVVDDHTLFRAGLRRLLESEEDFAVVAEAGNAAEALEKVGELRPDVVLMDIGMPGMSSFEAAQLMKEQWPGTRLIFLTMYEDQEYLTRCLNAGADGYLLKDVPPNQLIQAVREVHTGRKYFNRELISKLADGHRPHNRGGMKQSLALTPRERQIMKLIAEGLSVRQTAGRLGLSVKTVEAHKFNLMRKLDLHNRAQLVTYAIQKKIVKMPAEI